MKRFIWLLLLFLVLTTCSQSSSQPIPEHKVYASERPTRAERAERLRQLALEVKPVIDNRTPEQISQIACTKADGSWACKISQ